MSSPTPRSSCTFSEPLGFSFTDAVPLARHLKPLDDFLLGRLYTPVARDEILRHAGLFNTVECSIIDDEDRDTAEALLPDDPAWSLGVWDRIAYTVEGL